MCSLMLNICKITLIISSHTCKISHYSLMKGYDFFFVFATGPLFHPLSSLTYMPSYNKFDLLRLMLGLGLKNKIYPKGKRFSLNLVGIIWKAASKF